jgi:hypothetical protein
MNVKINPAGVLFYRRNQDTNKKEFLLQKRIYKKKIYLEDLGGKQESYDNSVYDVASREAAEESNGAFLDVDRVSYSVLLKLCAMYIKKLLEKEDTRIYYNYKSKYTLFITELPWLDTQTLQFGKIEKHPRYEIKRSMIWVPQDILINLSYKYIHPRIRHFCSKIYNI